MSTSTAEAATCGVDADVLAGGSRGLRPGGRRGHHVRHGSHPRPARRGRGGGPGRSGAAHRQSRTDRAPVSIRSATAPTPRVSPTWASVPIACPAGVRSPTRRRSPRSRRCVGCEAGRSCRRGAADGRGRRHRSRRHRGALRGRRRPGSGPRRREASAAALRSSICWSCEDSFPSDTAQLCRRGAARRQCRRRGRGHVHERRALRPAGTQRPCRRAARASPTGRSSSWWPTRSAPTGRTRTPADVMREIAEVAPSYKGITYAKLESPRVQWPCEAPSARARRSSSRRAFRTARPPSPRLRAWLAAARRRRPASCC